MPLPLTGLIFGVLLYIMYGMKDQENSREYLFVGRASDIKNKKDRTIYRALEMLPGFLAWVTFPLAIVLSYYKPVWISIFILLFAFYWLLKSIYLGIHTKSAYSIMLRHEKTNWIEKLKKLPKEKYTPDIPNWHDVWQLVIVPMYQEPYEIVSATAEAIADSDWPNEKILFILATEKRAGDEAHETALRVQQNYSDKFFKFLVTRHPDDIPGEVAGKGSNETWAARRAKEEIIDPLNIPYERILVSSFDSDTIVYPRYFSCLTYHFLTTVEPYRASYQPIPLFINNIWQAPAVSRVSAFSSTFWHTLSQERPEKQTTFSSHSMTYKALLDVGYWQTNVVSEDSRIFFQCFMHYGGDYQVISLYYPLAMDANVAHSSWQTLKNVYKQQRRWGFGSENIPYLLYGYYKDRRVPLGKFFRYAFNQIENFHAWATHALLLFVLGWLPIILGGDEFNTTLFSYNMLRMVRILLTVAMVGLVLSAFLSIQLLPPRPPKYGKWHYAIVIMQWFLIPIQLIVFGAFPAMEAQTRLMLGGKFRLGFWVTPKHRKE